MKINKPLQININAKKIPRVVGFFINREFYFVTLFLTLVSVIAFVFYYQSGLGLAYNDARSHLDIGRRVVEGLKPGLAQIGSVWLPLPHLLMLPTIWNDFMWHSGLAGALVSMLCFIATGIVIDLFLKKLEVGILARLFALAIFVFNINILYLQSTAMTELLLILTMTAGSYYLMLWSKNNQVLDLVKSAFWILLASLTRYDGWFLLICATLVIGIIVYRKRGYQTTEGAVILYLTLAAVGVALWFLWNLLIFKDPLYFIFGPFSARAQQAQIEAAGELITKGNIWISVKTYMYALLFNAYTFPAILGLVGLLKLLADKQIKFEIKLTSLTLIAPLIFNILALYMGHSVLFIAGLSGYTWFNVRYGVLVLPAIAIFSGYLIARNKTAGLVISGLLIFVYAVAYLNNDAVTIDDALVGSSQKNVTEVSGWLRENATDKKGFILISAASHDAIIFSSGLPMKRFIHEGTGAYWKVAVKNPDKWARWIVMRTNDLSDMTFRDIKDAPGFTYFTLVDHYPFADIYELKPEYLSDLITEPIIKDNK